MLLHCAWHVVEVVVCSSCYFDLLTVYLVINNWNGHAVSINAALHYICSSHNYEWQNEVIDKINQTCQC